MSTKSTPKVAGGKRKASKLSKAGEPVARRRKVYDLSSSVFKTFKSVTGKSDHSISKNGLALATDLTKALLHSIGEAGLELLHSTHGKTMNARTVEFATRSVLGGDELAKHAIAKGKAAVTNFNASKVGAASKRAKLYVSVPRVANFLRTKLSGTAERYSPLAAVFAAGVAQYVLEEIFELAVESSVAHKKKRVSPRHITLAVRGDKEIALLFRQSAFAAGGVHPHINAALVPLKVKSEASKAVKATKKPAAKKPTAKKQAIKKRAPKKAKIAC